MEVWQDQDMVIDIGMIVEGGEAAEDLDTGTVVRVEGDQVTVAWQSGVRTTQPASVLRVKCERCKKNDSLESPAIVGGVKLMLCGDCQYRQFVRDTPPHR